MGHIENCDFTNHTNYWLGPYDFAMDSAFSHWVVVLMISMVVLVIGAIMHVIARRYKA